MKSLSCMVSLQEGGFYDYNINKTPASKQSFGNVHFKTEHNVKTLRAVFKQIAVKFLLKISTYSATTA